MSGSLAARMPLPGEVIDLPRGAVYLANEVLRLQVSRVADGGPVHREQEWVTIEGRALNSDGSDRGYRSALVHVPALLRLMADRPPRGQAAKQATATPERSAS